MKLTIEYTDRSYDHVNCKFVYTTGVIMMSNIVRLSKEMRGDDDDITLIHLTNGDTLRTEDSIKTLEARINNEQ